MSSKSFFNEWRDVLIPLVGAFVIGSLWFVFIGHNVFLFMDGHEKSIIQWIDSQTECKWLKSYDSDEGVSGKWFKDKSDNELMKKEAELKC